MRLPRLSLAALAAAALALPAAAQDSEAARIVAEWASSPHADATSEAFTHWNGEGSVPPECAVCHAGAGFRDFHGLDGTAAGSVDATIATGGVVDCDTCHVDGALSLAQITFPSGYALQSPGAAGTCRTCHQGRLSGAQLAAALGDADPDTPNPELRFQNPHYAAAAATAQGSAAQGLFQYAGLDYAGPYTHVPAADSCGSCHSVHTLQVDTAACATCHETTETTQIRNSLTPDFDGDGDTTEGVAGEIATLKDRLMAEIRTYAGEVAGSALAYEPHSYPYFFVDSDGDGAASEDEAQRANAFAAWTPRLLQAAYNYQFAAKDPGGYAHNAAYTIQALHDSIVDLSGVTGSDTAGLLRP